MHMSEVCKLLKPLLVIPAMNAASERSASALRIKPYLRSTMSQSHLNNLYVHKELANSVFPIVLMILSVCMKESNELQNLEFNVICHYELFVCFLAQMGVENTPLTL